MRRKGLGLRIIFSFAVLICLTIPCAYSGQVPDKPEQVIPFSRVFVLNPFIIYEDARNEQNLESVDPAAQLIFDDLSAQWSTNVFSVVGIDSTNPISATSEQMSSIKEHYDLLCKNGEDLVKQWKDKQPYLNAFHAIRDVFGADCLLVQFIKVKVGERGSWDYMYSGRITPSTSSTSLKMAMIDLNSGKIWWSGASIEHSTPDKNNVKNLYKTSYGEFPGYKPKKGGKK